MSRSYRMLPLAQLVPALPGFAFPKTYAAWPVWKDSTTAEVRFGLVAALLCPWFVKGLYPLFTAAIVAPLLVWLGSFATCRDRSTARVSEFLGWLSYPLYCVHGPVIETTRYLYKHSDFLSRFGIPQQILSIVLALTLSVLLALLIDHLQVQRRLTDLLKRAARSARDRKTDARSR